MSTDSIPDRDACVSDSFDSIVDSNELPHDEALRVVLEVGCQSALLSEYLSHLLADVQDHGEGETDDNGSTPPALPLPQESAAELPAHHLAPSTTTLTSSSYSRAAAKKKVHFSGVTVVNDNAKTHPSVVCHYGHRGMVALRNKETKNFRWDATAPDLAHAKRPLNLMPALSSSSPLPSPKRASHCRWSPDGTSRTESESPPTYPARRSPIALPGVVL